MSRKLLKIVKQESKKGILKFFENVSYQLIFLSLDKLFSILLNENTVHVFLPVYFRKSNFLLLRFCKGCTTYTAEASCIGTSSRITSCSTSKAGSRSPTSGSAQTFRQSPNLISVWQTRDKILKIEAVKYFEAFKTLTPWPCFLNFQTVFHEAVFDNF